MKIAVLDEINKFLVLGFCHLRSLRWLDNNIKFRYILIVCQGLSH
jgi:hypothetical protein